MGPVRLGNRCTGNHHAHRLRAAVRRRPGVEHLERKCARKAVTKEYIMSRVVLSSAIILSFAVSGFTWRSSLYPESWEPGYTDSQGRFLHDFSYAGYHRGEREIPSHNDNIIDITQAPYHSDNTGSDDVTSLIQQALDSAGESGGGVVYLPDGTYRIRPQGNNDYSLAIRYSDVVLRGAGADRTFLFNDNPVMRRKDIILVTPP
ncbi:MAG: hypothetical protein GF350_14500, partial [Chitinivibrionales bacterium]|nr:hypothetical protein [Chitinivibrionales bacterium]